MNDELMIETVSFKPAVMTEEAEMTSWKEELMTFNADGITVRS